jgi:hypothetical protein
MTTILSAKPQNTLHIKPFPLHLAMGDRGWIPCKDKKRFSLPSSPDQLWGPTSLSPFGILRPAREDDPSRHIWAEIKNACSCTSTTPICLHEIVLNPTANRTLYSHYPNPFLNL